MHYLLIFFIIFLSCINQLIQKYIAYLSNYNKNTKTKIYMFILIILGITIHICMFFLWLWILQFIPIGIIYPVLSINFVFVTLASRWLFKEYISLYHGIGLLLISIGTVFIGINL